jgi:pyruvate kinase
MTQLQSLARKGTESIVPTKISWIAGLDPDVNPNSIRKTSIICTIGPNTNSVEKMIALRKAGMNIVRLNFSHGSHEVII